ncbi:MAG: hypothetical protein OXH49_04090 [Gemmatimonadetes bacterium]|nr:hypothetical protein [Gemmatimonadota bacterium]
MGVVDFLAVLPLWAFTGFDLKALRAFRLFVSTAKLAPGPAGAACGIMADALREASVGEGAG